MRDVAEEVLANRPGRQPPLRRSADALFFVGVVAGLVAGLLAGLLLVPRSGRDTRDDLRATMGVLLEPLRNKIAHARAEAQQAAAAAEQRVLRQYEAMKAEQPVIGS